jgi:hypothetical protein
MSEHFEEPEDSQDSEDVVVVDPWGYEPPKVAWVPIKEEVHKTKPTGETYIEERVTGFHIDPPFGLTWPHLRTLQHYAALIEHRTGMKVRVIQSTPGQEEGFPDDIPATFEVRTEHVAGQAAPYEVTYAWMSGYENGIHAVLWTASSK